MSDIIISGNSCSISCWCSRWDQQNKSIIVETYLTKSQLSTLQSNTRPGAVKSLYELLGDEHFYDNSFQGYNTLLLKPTPSSCNMNNSTLRDMRSQKCVFVKNISTHPLEGSCGLIECKIESMVSGSGL